jgi:hypothetical protein
MTALFDLTGDRLRNRPVFPFYLARFSTQPPHPAGSASGPVNLKDEFGNRYRIEKDSAFDHEASPAARQWLYTIPCANGGREAHLFSWGYRGGGRELAFYGSQKSGSLKDDLEAIAGIVVEQDAGDVFVASFPLSQFLAVAALVRPKERRRLSAERKHDLLAAGSRHRFQPRGGTPKSAPIRGAKGHLEPPGSTIGNQAVPKHVLK